MKLLVCFPALLWAATAPFASAGSATWGINPSNGDWNTAANWMPNTVPNSTTDVATFGASNLTDVTNADQIIMLDRIVFSPGAPHYTINALDNIELFGAGIVNGSGVMQSFVAGLFVFNNSSTAGEMAKFTTVDGEFFFLDALSAGSATFDLTDEDLQAPLFFEGGSTAGNATINASAGALISFFDSSSGGTATLNLTASAFADLAGNKAEHMSGTCMGGAGQFSSSINFEGSSDAGDGTFTAVGGSTSGEAGAFILLNGIATANCATFVINGGMGAGLTPTELFIMDSATAANANITANGGVDGSNGGAVVFTEKSKGGKASITLNGNATLDLTMHNTSGVTIGSLGGAGSALLGASTLTIGSNNGNTTFSGGIQGTGGVTKSGTGTLTLSGANTYTGYTTVSAGVLVANTKRGSSTGTGSVNVNAGTLGGKGTIGGPVTIGTGSGSGAILAPSVGSKQPLTLSPSSLLTLQGDSTYTCQLSTQKAQADEVIAQGVTLASGAQFTLQTVGNKRLSPGAVFTLISNTTATPINGTFANLANGSTLTAGRNKLKVSYTGGDGNDLTLTVQ